MTLRRHILFALLAFGIAAGSLPAAAQDKTITVFAAASMKNALDDVNAAFLKASGTKVVAIARAGFDKVYKDFYELPAIASSTPNYRAGTVTAVQRNAGQVMLITYQGSSPPNSVTGKTQTDAFERYEYWHAGQEMILTLSGPVGADNVDPWRTVTDSLRWQ